MEGGRDFRKIVQARENDKGGDKGVAANPMKAVFIGRCTLRQGEKASYEAPESRFGLSHGPGPFG